MDQSLSINRTDLREPHQFNDPLIHTEIFVQPATNDLQSESRGDLTVIISLNNPHKLETHLPTQSQTLFNTITNFYFSDQIGGALESLEEAVRRAHSQLESDQHKISAQIGAYACWGKTIVYTNSDKQHIGIRREHEFFELDNPATGNEQIKHDDLIIVATEEYSKSKLHPTLREHQMVSNSNFIQILKDQYPNIENNDKTSIAAQLQHVQIAMVPSEEEIIEINMPSSEKSPSNNFNLSKIFHTIYNKLPFQKPKLEAQKPEHTDEPQIYLKNNMSHTKRGKLLLVLVFLILLSASIYYTYQRNLDKRTEFDDYSILESTKEQVSQADQLSTLNPAQAMKLLEDARTNINSVLGVRDDVAQEKESLTNQLEQILNKIYRFEEVTPSLDSPEPSLLIRVFHIDADTLSDFTRETLAERTSEWEAPIQADSYFNNVYVLDPTANAIWKYPDLLVQPLLIPPTNYILDHTLLADSIDLTVDGSVFILFPDRVEKFTVGERESFGLSGVFPGFSPNSLITTGTNSDQLFISSEMGISIFSKDGIYEKTLFIANPSQIDELLVNNDSSELYFKQEGEWYRINP